MHAQERDDLDKCCNSQRVELLSAMAKVAAKEQEVCELQANLEQASSRLAEMNNGMVRNRICCLSAAYAVFIC
jgi:hypothetical protein